jgi:hypothetical protein
MTFFADLDPEGRVRGFYAPEIHGDAIPEGAIEISEAVYADWLTDTARQRWNGEALEACDPPPPPAPRPVTDVSFWQFMMAAWKAGFITHEEALAAVRSRIMPAAFALVLSDLSEQSRQQADIKFAGITRVLRSDSVFQMLVNKNLTTDEEIDAVFAMAAAIT